MANEEDLVSQVAVEGIDETSANLKKMADDGESAFQRIGDAAVKAGAAIATGTKNITASLSSIQPPSPMTAQRLAEITDGIGLLKVAIPASVSAVVSFTGKIAALGLTMVGSVTAIAKFASATTKSFRALSDATSSNTEDTKANGKAQVQSVQQANSYSESLGKLQDQLRSGKIDYNEYSKGVKQLNTDFDRNKAAVDRVTAAQEDARKKNKSAQDAETQAAALKKLTDQYGGPLTNSLINLGNTYDQIHRQAVDAFSPALSKLVDAVGGVIDRNRVGITKFIDDTSAALSKFIDNNGPAIEKFFSGLGDIIKGAGTVIVTYLIPKLQNIMDVADKVAVVLNKVFGTEFTGGTLIAAAAILKLTGAFGTVKTIIQGAIIAVQGLALVFGVSAGWIVLIVAGLVLLGVALYNIDWKAFGERASSALDRIKKWFTDFPTNVKIIMVVFWDWIKTSAADAADWAVAKWNAFLKFFTDFPTNAKIVLVVFWDWIKSVGADAAQWVQDKWDGLLQWFTDFPTNLKIVFSALWEAIKQAATDTAQWVQDKWQEFVDFCGTIPDTVGQFFIDLWEGVKQTAQEAFDAISTKIKEWIAKVMPYIQPLLDGIKKIKDYFNSGEGAGGGNTAPSFAGGGAVRGPGTSISDSIMAWLSNNEFVMKAKAVGKYGLGFMHAINEGKLDLGKVAGFAAGGLINSLGSNPVPKLAFAGGGAVNTRNMRPLSLTIGNETFNGLMMPEDVGNKLTKFAVGRQVSSAGRKPSWVGGRR